MAGTNEFLVNTQTNYTQNDATVAVLKNGNYVIAWIDTQGANGQSPNLSFRIFGPNGAAVTSQVIATDPTTDQPANVRSPLSPTATSSSSMCARI